MRHYENLVIVKPTLTEEEIKNTLAIVEEFITSNGGEIIARDAMGMKNWLTRSRKTLAVIFTYFITKIAPSAISEIERRFRINEEILRFVTMKYDTKREIKAWNDMVEKTKKVAPAAVVAEKTEEVAS